MNNQRIAVDGHWQGEHFEYDGMLCYWAVERKLKTGESFVPPNEPVVSDSGMVELEQRVVAETIMVKMAYTSARTPAEIDEVLHGNNIKAKERILSMANIRNDRDLIDRIGEITGPTETCEIAEMYGYLAGKDVKQVIDAYNVMKGNLTRRLKRSNGSERQKILHGLYKQLVSNYNGQVRNLVSQHTLSRQDESGTSWRASVQMAYRACIVDLTKLVTSEMSRYGHFEDHVKKLQRAYIN